MNGPSFNPNCGACGGLNSRGFCNYTACIYPCIYPCSSGLGGYINKPKTKANSVRSMSDEELAEWISTITECGRCPVGTPCTGPCVDNLLAWLREEVQE